MYYYVVVDTGAFVLSDIGFIETSEDDLARILMGNCFRTRALAEQAFERVLEAFRSPGGWDGV